MRVQLLDCVEVEGLDPVQVHAQPCRPTRHARATTRRSSASSTTHAPGRRTTRRCPPSPGRAQPGQTLTATPGHVDRRAGDASSTRGSAATAAARGCSPIAGATGHDVPAHVGCGPRPPAPGRGDGDQRARDEPARLLAPDRAGPDAARRAAERDGLRRQRAWRSSTSRRRSDGGGALTYTVTVSPGGIDGHGLVEPDPRDRADERRHVHVHGHRDEPGRHAARRLRRRTRSRR